MTPRDSIWIHLTRNTAPVKWLLINRALACPCESQSVPWGHLSSTEHPNGLPRVGQSWDSTVAGYRWTVIWWVDVGGYMPWLISGEHWLITTSSFPDQLPLAEARQPFVLLCTWPSHKSLNPGWNPFTGLPTTSGWKVFKYSVHWVPCGNSEPWGLYKRLGLPRNAGRCRKQSAYQPVRHQTSFWAESSRCTSKSSRSYGAKFQIIQSTVVLSYMFKNIHR